LGIAEPVPSETRNLAPVCFGYASQPLVLLAMTKEAVDKYDPSPVVWWYNMSNSPKIALSDLRRLE